MSSSSLSSVLWDFFPKIKTVSVAKKKRFLSTFGLSNPSAKAFFISDYLRRTSTQKLIFILERKNEVLEYQTLFESFLGDEYGVLTFPFTQNQDVIDTQKCKIIQQYASEKKKIILLSREQAQFLYPHPGEFKKYTFELTKGQKIKQKDLFLSLENAGYKASVSIDYLEEGEFIRTGDIIKIFPLGETVRYEIETEFDEITNITQEGNVFEKIKIAPFQKKHMESLFPSFTNEHDVFCVEEFLDIDEDFQKELLASESKIIESSDFPRNESEALHLRFISLPQFYTLADFLNDLREKINTNWKIMYFSRRFDEMKGLFEEERVPFSTTADPTARLMLIDAQEIEHIPPSFQNPEEKILFLTDREVFQMQNAQKRSDNNQDMSDFLTSLKPGDFVVHADHGIGRFLGICEQELSGITKEYLEVEYAKSDRLFVPISSADKISRFITDEEKDPKLSKLGGAEWTRTQGKAKVESEKIAKELLAIYAERERAKAMVCDPDTPKMKEFEEAFEYVPTPGQMASIRDIKKDLEGKKPMDRLVCGDVGFGKTEVAMRAAFKAVENGLQVALIAPITILVDQHYKSFKQRFLDFGIRIEVISRFKSPAEQAKTLAELKKGKIDIIIGTHRLLSADVKFHNLGLLIIDEEQRFGVKQKEKIKAMRKDVHILTMTATPIPRTLNLSLHKLRDISTITTPPPGRLPVVTEVRKYSDKLIREAILKELERDGQVYFLHNRVQTIEGIADKLRMLVPEATFEVAHGQMAPHQLEKKIDDFKKGNFKVLISSTIIENGIDLANANTMIINNADRFGLSQLYQLRGRIGRSSKQAYAYLLYNAQKLPIDAKKRLRAIVEASELGSGFQLSMRDLEIRGAGDVLGVSQHGSVNSVGVNHFLKLLKKTLKTMEAKESQKDGINEEIEDVQIEMPINAFIPSFYIPDNKEKIVMYQRFAGIDTLAQLEELGEELKNEYGKLPPEVKNLMHVLEMKYLAKQAKVHSIIFQKENIELKLGKSVTAKEIMQLLSVQEGWTISGDKLIIPRNMYKLDFIGKLKEALEALTKKITKN